MVAFTHAADPAAVPDPVAARRRRRHRGLAGAVRSDLRVPRPAGRHRRGRRPGGAAARRGAGGGRASRTCRSATARTATDRGRCDDIDLVVPAGTRTAIVGETGAGKTTLGYLVARLYEPQQGRVTIDGVDVRDASLESLAATVGVVSQETYLFHASVRENLRFARPDATDEEIEEAARTARIHDLIASLPDGYDTIVGERGLPLLGRREAADGDRADDPAQPAGAGARRGHQLARHADRGRGSGRARAAGGGTHHDHHRPPPLHRPRRRSDRRARPAARSPSAGPTRSCSSAAACTRRWSRAT